MHARLQRKARADLECRLGGLDVPSMKRDASESRRHAAAVAELETKHARELNALETKLAWYRDNQTIIDHDRETIHSQAAQIRQLQAKLGIDVDSRSGGDQVLLGQLDGSRGSDTALRQSGALLTHQLTVAKRRIAELEKDLSSAQQTLDRRHPDSLANLIRAAKGSEGAVGEPAQLLQELARVREEAQSAAEAHDRNLRALRQQHELLKAQYSNARSSDAQELVGTEVESPHEKDALMGVPSVQTSRAAPSNAASMKREAALKSRLEAVEKELERVRAFYVAKVKELTAQVKELQATSPAAVGLQHSQTRVSSATNRSSPLKGAASTRPAGLGASSARRPSASQTAGTCRPSSVASTGVSEHKVEAQGFDKSGEGSCKPLHDLIDRPSTEAPISTSSAGILPVAAAKPHSVNDDLRILATTTTTVSAVTMEQQLALQSSLDSVLQRVTMTEEKLRLMSDENNLLRQLHSRENPPTTTDSASSRVPVDAVLKPSQGYGVTSALVTPGQNGVGSEIYRLSSAIQILEARAEARELELVRAERAALSVHDGQLDLERSRFREALRIKDEALAQCRNELLQMMSVLQAQR